MTLCCQYINKSAQICLQNLTDVQERYRNISARRRNTVAAVKPQSDRLRTLLGMINSIRAEAQNKLADVKGNIQYDYSTCLFM